MRVKLWVTTGIAVGFMLGSWTPLGDLGSPDSVRGLLAKSRTGIDSQATETIASLGRFRTLIAAAKREPRGNILQNQEIVQAAGLIDPQSAWAMQLSELGGLSGHANSGSTAMASYTDHANSGNRNAGTNHAIAVMGVPDTDAWYSLTSEPELARLRTTISEIRAENRDIKKGLGALDPAHPDHYMALCIFTSNEALIAFYSFLTDMGEGGANLEDTASLEMALEEARSLAIGYGHRGREKAGDYKRVLEGLPAETSQDARIKARALEYYDSFLLSFELEDTLAAHLAVYPPLIEEAIRSGKPPSAVSQWVADFQELGRGRMELQAYRQEIAQELAGPNV